MIKLVRRESLAANSDQSLFQIVFNNNNKIELSSTILAEQNFAKSNQQVHLQNLGNQNQ